MPEMLSLHPGLLELALPEAFMPPASPSAVGRKQFMKFECANNAAEVLGCDVEELTTAVFKHHLKQILAQVAARGHRLPPAEDSPAGTGMLYPFFLF